MMMTKRLITSVFIALIGVSVFAQKNSRDTSDYYWDDQQDNEVRVNFLMAIIGLPEINYERYLSENMGVGMAMAFSIEKVKDMTLRSMILPYCRVYFGEKKSNGFFIEGNMAMVSQKEAVNYYNIDGNYLEPGYNTATALGFGAAVGFKLLTRGGVTGELYLGAGRLFGNPIDRAYPRCGICIGKRF